MLAHFKARFASVLAASVLLAFALSLSAHAENAELLYESGFLGTGKTPECPTAEDIASGAAENRGQSGSSLCTGPAERSDDTEDEAPESPVAVEFSGALDVGTRIFPRNRQFAGQARSNALPYIGGWGRVNVSWDEGNSRFTVQPYGRYDILARRDLVDVAEAHVFHRAGNWSALAGVHTVFWGVTESRHLVDVINQIDRTGDVDEEDRLGQPMLNFNWLGGDVGTLSLFALAGFREQNFPERKDRLRGPVLVSERSAIFNEEGLTRHLAFAARYFNTFDIGVGSADFAVSYFNGMGRTPLLTPALLAGGPALIPVYDRIDKVGNELLIVNGDLQLKFEGSYSRQFRDDVFAAVGGFEYTLNDFLASGIDIGLLAEYLFDDRNNNQPVVTGDNDVFGGLRMTFNNEFNTQLLAGVTVDHKTEEIFGSLDVTSRLTDDISLSVALRMFGNVPGNSPHAFLNKDDYIDVKFTKYF